MKKIYSLLIILSLASWMKAQNQTTPLSEDLINDNNNLLPDTKEQITSGKHGLGLTPSPVNFDFTGFYAKRAKSIKSFQQVYSLKSEGLMTSVKDQGSCGSCWTFATMGSVESGWKKLGFGINDLSEDNLNNCHHFDNLPCYGGNAMMSAAYFSRLGGPILDSKDIYQPLPPYYGYCPTDVTPTAFITDARFLPNDGAIIKQALLDHGALYTSMHWRDSSYNDTTKTYYYDGNLPENHAVVLAGWNDTNTTAGGTGAWLVKNSWGTAWADTGYFYVSYNDTKILSQNAYFPTRLDYDKKYKAYYYAEYGYLGNLGYNDSTAYGLVKYTASENQEIKSIGTWIPSANTTVSIEFYNNFDGTNLTGLLSSVTDYVCDYPGYYTIDLPEPISIQKNNDFFIKVKYYTPGALYPIPVEQAIPGDVSNPVIETGKCWISHSGSAWLAIGNNTTYEKDLCINAYAVSKAIVQKDMEALELVSPHTGYALSLDEPVVIRLRNSGSDTLTNFIVAYSMNGGIFIQETYTGDTVLPLESIDYTFSQTADFSAIQSYSLKLFVSASGDTIHTNDTIVAIIENLGGKMTGVYNVPGDYFTIKEAIEQIDLRGVDVPGVTVNVAAGHTETSSNMILQTETDSLRPVIFQKSGTGANPKVTAESGTSPYYDFFIYILGTNYVTFDGIDLEENTSNTDAITQMEYGYTISALNDETLDLKINIRNCNITLSDTFDHVIQGISFCRSNDSYSKISGSVSNSDISNNVITNTYYGISNYVGYGSTYYVGKITNSNFNNNNIKNTWYGIYTAGKSGARNEYNKYNGNTLNDWGGVGIQCPGYDRFVEISGNTFTNTDSSSARCVSLGYVFDKADIFNNHVTLSHAVANRVFYLYMSHSLLPTPSQISIMNIHDNTIENSHFTGLSGSSTYGFYITGFLYVDTINCYRNTISGNLFNGGFIGIYKSGSSVNSRTNLFENEIYNNSSDSGAFTGINPATACYIWKNNIYNNSTQLNNGKKIIGIAGTGYIFQNNIYNLTSNNSPTGCAYGINSTGATIYNNFISDIKATGATGLGVCGIYIASGTSNVYNNSIFLNASSSSTTTFSTAGIYALTAATLDMKNNIIVNTSTPGPTGGRTAAYQRSSATISTYLCGSTANCFYAGTPSTNRLIYYDGTTSCQTITDYKNKVTPLDMTSFSELPPFINTTTTPYDLRLKTDVPTICEKNGMEITAINLSTDYDGENRDTIHPDIGADEINGIALDLCSPFISCITTQPSSNPLYYDVLGVTIHDVNSVDTTSTFMPRIYFKKKTNSNVLNTNDNTTDGWKYTKATAIYGQQFDFRLDYLKLFGGGVSVDDTIQFFIVAQDTLTTPNVGINKGALASQPASVDLTTAAFPVISNLHKYRVVGIICGTKTIGTGGDYATIPAALTSLMNNEITCPVKFLFIDTLYTLTSTQTISTLVGGSSVNTVTFKPATNINASIKLNSASSPVFTFNAANIIFDGANTESGETRNLTIMNIGANGSSSNPGLLIKSANIKIKNINISTTATAWGADITFQTGTNDALVQNCNIYNRGIRTTGSSSNINIFNNNFLGTSVQLSNVNGYNFINNVISVSSMSAFSCSGKTKICNNNIAGQGVYGIYVEIGNDTLTIANNMISISADSTGDDLFDEGMHGIEINQNNHVRIYNNSVYLTGTQLYPGTSGALSLIVNYMYAFNHDIRNNILVNNQVPTGNGNAYALNCRNIDNSNTSLNFKMQFYQTIRN
ncbi:MAG: hypothetical protein HY958_06225 [Bacteroidia bacterium]|nr:hypothetical protein [Bacteroidia bacterium]